MQASTSRSLPADIGPEAEDNRKTETEVAANSTGSDVEILENQLDARANVQHATSSTAADAQATATTANDVQATATTRATTATQATAATRAAPAARAAANALASAAALVAFSAVRAAVRAIFVRLVISKALGVPLPAGLELHADRWKDVRVRAARRSKSLSTPQPHRPLPPTRRSS
ncbi:hypothetical protein C8R48DRAFT_781246 [Suillus tomentosus]|nr:hypothetical protein C8R48DRAFT_781246 [Suillus tomentosus]